MKSSVFGHALQLEAVTRNPTEGVRLPRIQQTESRWYSNDELGRLFESTEGDRFHALWVVLGTLGLRLGESLGLKWTDLDLARGTLTVQRKLERDRFGGGLVLSEPKTKTSQRTLTLTAPLRLALKAHEDRQKFKREHTEGWLETGLVFCTGVGEDGRLE